MTTLANTTIRTLSFIESYTHRVTDLVALSIPLFLIPVTVISLF